MIFRNEKEPFLRHVVHQLINLVGFLLEIIKQKDQELLPIYRLVDWEEKKGIGYCRIQIVGTNSINDYTPETIANDDDFISGFGKFDIRTITNLANLEKYKPKAAVCSVMHEEKKIGIVEPGGECDWVEINENLYTKINDFSKEDAFKIGRMVGEKDTLP